ncbi:MAG: hypothetical protein HY040_00495 [Planctomycetes bacterium]|nr:hypothetical protein [Planctomycetota bacterium]
MAFIAQCLYCQNKMQAPASAAGMSVRCPKCQNFFTVFPMEQSSATQDGRFRAKPETAKAIPHPAPVSVEIALPVPVPLKVPAKRHSQVIGPAKARIPAIAHAPVNEASTNAPAADQEESPLEPPAILMSAAIEVRAPTIIFAESALEQKPAVPLLKRPGSMTGVVALVLTGLGLVCASFTPVALLTAPLSACGLLIGLAGWASLVGQPSRRTARALPIAASAIGAVVLFVAMIFPSALGPTYALVKQGGGSSAGLLKFIPIDLASGTATPLQDQGWANASLAAVQQDQIRVQILAAEFKTIDVRPEKPEITGKKFMVVQLRLQQVGATRGLEYHHWGPHSPWPDKPAPILLDAKGKPYRPLTFADGTLIHGQQIKKELYASATLPDFLVFDVPAAKGESYRLTLPAYAWGGKSDFKFALSANFMKH